MYLFASNIFALSVAQYSAFKSAYLTAWKLATLHENCTQMYTLEVNDGIGYAAQYSRHRFYTTSGQKLNSSPALQRIKAKVSF